MESAPTYWIYRYRSRDVLAVPANKRVIRAAGAAAIPAHTRLSRMYRTFLRGAIALGADGAVAERWHMPVPRFREFQWTPFLETLATALARKDFRAVVVQPPQSHRNRFYVHAFSTFGTRLAFAKVSMDEENDRQLAREAAVLGALPGTSFRHFRLPAILAGGKFDGRSYLLLEPLPALVKTLDPLWSPVVAHIRHEIAGEPKEVANLESLGWWPEFAARAPLVPRFLEALTSLAHVPLSVCPSHGDFTSWNICAAVGTYWVFDWEAYAPDAPLLADELRFHLGIYTRQIARDPRGVAQRLFGHFGCTDPSRNADALRALAFLHAREVDSATSIARVWASSAVTT